MWLLFAQLAGMKSWLFGKSFYGDFPQLGRRCRGYLARALSKKRIACPFSKKQVYCCVGVKNLGCGMIFSIVPRTQVTPLKGNNKEYSMVWWFLKNIDCSNQEQMHTQCVLSVLFKLSRIGFLAPACQYKAPPPLHGRPDNKISTFSVLVLVYYWYTIRILLVSVLIYISSRGPELREF